MHGGSTVSLAILKVLKASGVYSFRKLFCRAHQICLDDLKASKGEFCRSRKYTLNLNLYVHKCPNNRLSQTMKKRLGKKQWLTKALEVLAESGVDQIKIERLAEELGMSRNGFYYHFRNRDHFLEELLEYWEHESTRIISSDRAIQELSPEHRFERVIEMVHKHKVSKYDLAIMSWAKKDQRVRRVLNRVFALRLDFVGKIFEDLGFTGEELEIRTRLFVAYHANASDIFDDYYSTKSKKFHIHQLKLLMLE